MTVVGVRRAVAVRHEEIWQPLERYLPDEAYAVLVEDDDRFVQQEVLASSKAPNHIVPAWC